MNLYHKNGNNRGVGIEKPGEGSRVIELYMLTCTMDSITTIITQKQNQVLKSLAVITVVLSFPVLISSLFGMNASSGFENIPYVFYIVVFVSLIISLTTKWIFFQKNIF